MYLRIQAGMNCSRRIPSGNDKAKKAVRPTVCQASHLMHKQIAENLRIHLSTHNIDKQIQVTGSIGVAGTAPGEEDINILIKESDQALYLAKAKGRKNVVLWNERGEKGSNS